MLAVSWYLLVLATAVTTLVVSVVVFRRLDYTFEAMAMLSLVPPFQAFVVCFLARGDSPHRRLPELITLASCRSVRVVWGLAALAIAAWVLVYRGFMLPGVDPRSLMTLISGVALSSAGMAFMRGVLRRADKQGLSRLALCALACESLGLLCIAAGLGFRLSILPSFGVVTAIVWALTAAVLLPVFLHTASALRPGPALLLETAAVLAVASMSLVPILLYLRPYLGAAWLDPCRFALVLGALLTLTASLRTEPPLVPEATLSPVETSSKVLGWIALWLTLQGSYLIGWLGLGFALGGMPELSLGGLLQLALIPAVQFFAVSRYQSLRLRRLEVV